MNWTRSFGVAAAAGAGLLYAWSRRRRARFDGETALITGSSRGLGYLLAREFGRRGCRVVVCARDREELQGARARLQDEGIEATSVVCDVRDPDQVRHLVDRARRAYGPVDILVNNAGVIEVGPLTEMSLEDFEEAMETMYWGTFHPSWEVLPEMIRRDEGHIVNITSIGGRVSVPHLVPYCSAKFAAVGFSEGLRAEMDDTGIEVTTIVPGLMRTGSFHAAEFKGRHTSEYTWFALASSTPGVSMSVERAARKIVDTVARGRGLATIGFPAKILELAHGLAPGLVTRLVGLVGRYLLPDSTPGRTDARPGRHVEKHLDSPEREWLQRATTLGQRAARKFQPP